MDRRRTFATAGAVALSVVTATVAGAASLGLLSLASANEGRVGKLQPVEAVAPTSTTTAPQVETVYVDDPPVEAAVTPTSVSGRPSDDRSHGEPSRTPVTAPTLAPSGDPAPTVTTAPKQDDHAEAAEPESAGRDDDD
jgi:hypothetical protein